MLVLKVAEDWPKPEVPGDVKGHGTFARKEVEERSAEKITPPERSRNEVKKENRQQEMQNVPGGPSLIGMGP
jgi:hypothetical protein